MADERPPSPPARVPTLTEVVAEPRGNVAAAPAAASPEPTAIDEGRIVGQVLAEVLQRVDLMFEYRIRETLAPLLARLTDSMLQEVRDELARTLRDVVSRAVSQELSKRRPR